MKMYKRWTSVPQLPVGLRVIWIVSNMLFIESTNSFNILFSFQWILNDERLLSDACRKFYVSSNRGRLLSWRHLVPCPIGSHGNAELTLLPPHGVRLYYIWSLVSWLISTCPQLVYLYALWRHGLLLNVARITSRHTVTTDARVVHMTSSVTSSWRHGRRTLP